MSTSKSNQSLSQIKFDKFSFFYSNQYKWEFYNIDGIFVAFSGKVYNLKDLGFDSNVDSVSEFFFKKYKSIGDNFLREINGKATLIINESGSLKVFRDQWGEGPLLFLHNNQLSDCMEGILKEFSNSKKLNLVSLNSFLMYGFIPAPLTIIDGVFLVPAGHCGRKEADDYRFENLFDFEYFKSGNIKIELPEAIAEYDRLLKQSIRRRIENQSVVGALLSGGYDSGGNIAVLREVFSGEIKSYSIGFRDNPFSELPYAKLMAETFGATHHEYLMDHNDIQSLPDAVKAFGQPFSESGFMLNNAAMKLVSTENLPVIIGGDGNDQLFGTTGKELAIRHLLQSKGLHLFQKTFSALSANNLFEKDNILYKLRFHNHKILNSMRPDNFGFNSHMMNSLFKIGKVDEHPVFAEIPSKYAGFENLHDLHNLYLDIRHSINEVILNKASRLSQFYGNNLAFTYLDRDIYMFIKSLPLEIRVRGDLKSIAKGKGVTKYLHKAYTKPKLPEDVTSRKKQGGFSPLSIFFDNSATRQSIYKYIKQSAFAKEFMNEKALASFLSDYETAISGETYWFWFKQLKSNQLINLLIMALWTDIYLNGRNYNTLDEYMM